MPTGGRVERRESSSSGIALRTLLMVGHPNVHDLHRVEPEPDEVGGDCPGAVGRTGLQPVVDGDRPSAPPVPSG